MDYNEMSFVVTTCSPMDYWPKTPALLFFASPNGPSLIEQVRDSMFDDTFQGLHHLAPFDYAILIPYFTVLIVLSFYGLHRYKVIHEYFKFKKKFAGVTPTLFQELP